MRSYTKDASRFTIQAKFIAKKPEFRFLISATIVKKMKINVLKMLKKKKTVINFVQIDSIIQLIEYKYNRC